MMVALSLSERRRRRQTSASSRSRCNWCNRLLDATLLLLGLAWCVTYCSPMASALTMTPPPRHFVGIDLGTSGCRISVLLQKKNHHNQHQHHQLDEVYTQAMLWDKHAAGMTTAYDNPLGWVQAVKSLLRQASSAIDDMDSVAVCISGTSASCTLMDRTTGQPTRGQQACMYDYAVKDKAVVRELVLAAPPKHTATSPTGSLAKLLAWQAEQPLAKEEVLAHQADFCLAHLLEKMPSNDNASSSFQVVSDWHNCLKLGYDVRQLTWPAWLTQTCLQDQGLEATRVLPQRVVSPGHVVGLMDADIAVELGLPARHTQLVAGTTDSNAAFIAAAGSSPSLGTAVTSLGSTLAIKLLSPTYVEDAAYGVYSHRFPSALLSSSDDNSHEDEAWLVGGASNVGCAIFRQLDFSNQELDDLSANINPLQRSPYEYYPLTKTGERFPVADPEKQAMLEPRPESRQEFLHGLLESITAVEMQGFARLHDMGAPWPSHVWTCGGGSRNNVWIRMREDRLQTQTGNTANKVDVAPNTEASYGAALLAAASFVVSSQAELV